MKNSLALDDSTQPLTQILRPFTALQAVLDGYNTLLAFIQLPKLLAQLDVDVLTGSDYVSTTSPLKPADTRTKFNALLAKLDADVIVGDTNYAALLTANVDADLVTQWPLLLAKLDVDSGVPLTTYTASNALPFVTTIDAKPRAL